jgi:hypothetical protein
MRPAGTIALVTILVAVGAAAAMSGGYWSSKEQATTLGAGAHPFVTGFLAEDAPDATQIQIDRRIASIGSRIIRIHALWREIAPAVRRGSFHPTDPRDPAYRWRFLDGEVRHAHDAGLQVMLTVTSAPHWAERSGTNKERYAANDPDPYAFADFATALAKRYGGSVAGRPRVSLYEVWNEPNVSFYFTPQTEAASDGSRVDVAATKYRALVNAFADAVHKVNPDNVVGAGSLAPFTIRGVSYVETTGGIRFMRELLCLSVTGPPVPTCNDKVHFDALTFHPYTSGGPTHQALNPGDLSLGDMPEARVVLDAGIRAGHVVSERPVAMWVTEFSWDTKPPDPQAVPAGLHARWVAEAIYRMWKSGVSMLVWYQVRDWMYPGTDYQSGLWYRGKTLTADRPKPGLQAFRFPFVAYAKNGRIAYWGRTDSFGTASVTIELNAGRGWRRAGSIVADRYGVFSGSLRSTATKGLVRAVTPTDRARPFSLALQPDRHVTPFGVGSIK